jgi:hypothetical protein
MGLSSIAAKDTAHAGTILAPRDRVEDLAESGTVTVWKRKHLCLIETKGRD